MNCRNLLVNFCNSNKKKKNWKLILLSRVFYNSV